MKKHYEINRYHKVYIMNNSIYFVLSKNSEYNLKDQPVNVYNLLDIKSAKSAT